MKLKATSVITILVLLLFMISCESEESIEFKRYYSAGVLVYQTHCQNCHGANGEGLSSLIPSLNDSLYLKSNKSSLACYIKSGLKSKITIKGKTFDDAMPANDLSPIEIAQVLTYIGNSFGNKLNTVTDQNVQTTLTNCR